MFLLDICCQHLEKICNFEGFCLGNVHLLLDIWTTFGEYMSVGGFLCALPAQGW